MLRVWASAVAAIAIVGTLPDAAQEQAPRFKGGVNVIRIDTRVLDRDGRPIRGLTAADFTVLEDGRLQRIVGLSEIVIPEYRVAPTGWLRDVAPDVRTNRLPEGRLLVIVIDDALLPFDPTMVQQTKEIGRTIVESMGPGDLASVVFTLDSSKAQDFTADRARLLKAIDRTAANFVFSAPNDSKAVDSDAHYYLASGSSLHMLSEALAGIPDKRKTVAYIGIGVPFSAENIAPQLIGPDTSMADRNLHADMRDRTIDLLRGSLGSQMTIYTFDPSGLGGLDAYKAAHPSVKVPDSQRFRDYLREVATNTGGRATVDTNDPAGGVDRMFRESSAYYVLGFETANTAKDGKLRRLEINVNRAGAQVLARNSYYAPKAEKGPARAQSTENAAVAIGQVLPKGGLPMQAMAAPFAGSGSKAAVAIVTGLKHPVPAGARTESVDMLVTAFDQEGRAKASKRQTVRLQLRQTSAGEARYEILTRLDLNPGRYQVRIGAHPSATAETGSVYLDVEVPDFAKDGLSASGVIFTSAAAPMAAPANALSGVVPVIPTTLRYFMRTDRVSGHLRLYQGGKTPLVPVLVATRIVDEGGVTVWQGRTNVAVDRFAARATDVPIAIPLADLTPGRYLLDVHIEAITPNPQRQTRQTPFVVER